MTSTHCSPGGRGYQHVKPIYGEPGVYQVDLANIAHLCQGSSPDSLGTRLCYQSPNLPFLGTCGPRPSFLDRYDTSRNLRQ